MDNYLKRDIEAEKEWLRNTDIEIMARELIDMNRRHKKALADQREREIGFLKDLIKHQVEMPNGEHTIPKRLIIERISELEKESK